MLELDNFQLKKIKDEKNYSEFEISPLPRGYGHTIANSLRRILLSSIQGASVVAVKLNGVEHEYTALDGVQDDVLEILLRLQNLSLIVHTEDEVVLKLNKKGNKTGVVEVTSGDIEPNPNVDIIDKNFLITKLTKPNAKVDAEIKVKRGIGYAYPNEGVRKEIGNLPVGADFNPVTRVEVEITQARVGQRTDFDKIVLKVTTNGTKTPSEALLEAVEIYDTIANRLVSIAGGDPKALEKETAEKKEEQAEERVLVSEVNMSTRLTNSLLNSGIATLNELNGKTTEEVMNFRGMGKKSYEELVEILADFGFSLKD